MKNILSLKCLGAASEVGRSCFLLQGSKKILLDGGIKLTEEDEEYPLLDMSEARRLDRIVLSHAHLDHSGFLPYLYREGSRARCVMTKPTRDLIQVLLADYVRLNKSGTAYADADVRTLLQHARILEYDQAWEGVCLYPAGHILGSALTLVEADGHRVLYTGDVNLRQTRLLEGAQTGFEADTLLIESTYGAKTDQHISLKEAANQLVEAVQRTLAQGGKVLIPTFAIGRGQELLFLLENHMRSGVLEEAPIYLDGMVNKVLRIYRHNAIYLRKEVQYRILSSDDDPFKSRHYLVPKTKDRSDVLQQEKAIILATSGMLNGGPVLHYLKHLGPDEKNTLILSGFQAKGTRGRALLEGARELDIDGQIVPINVRVEQTKLSGHADHRQLVEFAKKVTGLRHIVVVHGEDEKSRQLAETLQKNHPHAQVYVPRLGEEIVLKN